MSDFKNKIKYFLNSLTGFKLIKNKYPGDSEIKKVLIISLYFTGDLLFHTAVIEYIYRYFEGIKIDLWSKSSSSQILSEDKRINEILVFDNMKTYKYRNNSRFDLKGKINFIKKIRSKNYDLVIDLTGKYSTALFTLFANASYTSGLNYNYFGFCYDKFVYLNTSSESGHLIKKYLSFTDKILGKPENYHVNELKISTRPYLNLSETGIEILTKNNKIKNNLLKNGYIVIHLTSGWAAKELPIQQFSDIIMYLDKIEEEYYFIGDNKDKEKLDEIKNYTGGKINNLNERYLNFTIIESAAFIKNAKLFIGSDSAPLHLAAAYEVPSIGIFGPTNPAFSAPIGENVKIIYHQLECSAANDKQYCTKNGGFTCPKFNCMLMIKSSEIISAVNELLNLNNTGEMNVKN